MLKNIHTFWKENSEFVGNAISVVVAGITVYSVLWFSYIVNRGF